MLDAFYYVQEVRENVQNTPDFCLPSVLSSMSVYRAGRGSYDWGEGAQLQHNPNVLSSE